MATIQSNTGHEKLTEKALADAKGTLSLRNLVGKWNTCDKNTRNIVRVVLGAKGSSLTVQVFGACSPTPCDWGVVAGIAYGDNVSATDATAFSAVYSFGGADVVAVSDARDDTPVAGRRRAGAEYLNSQRASLGAKHDAHDVAGVLVAGVPLSH